MLGVAPSPRSSPIRIAPGVDWNRFTDLPRREFARERDFLVYTHTRGTDLDDLFGEFSFLKTLLVKKALFYEEIEYVLIKIPFWTHFGTILN